MSDVPVASQEAEARAWLEPDHAEFCVCIVHGAPEPECDCDYAGEVDKLDAYAAAIRTSERERYAALVEAASEILPLQATGPDWWRCALCGHKERQLTRDPAAMHDANCAWLALRAALAALEEAGSA